MSFSAAKWADRQQLTGRKKQPNFIMNPGRRLASPLGRHKNLAAKVRSRVFAGERKQLPHGRIPIGLGWEPAKPSQ